MWQSIIAVEYYNLNYDIEKEHGWELMKGEFSALDQLLPKHAADQKCNEAKEQVNLRNFYFIATGKVY